MRDFLDRIKHHGDRKVVTFVGNNGHDEQHLCAGELYRQAVDIALRLQAEGIAPGERVQLQAAFSDPATGGVGATERVAVDLVH